VTGGEVTVREIALVAGARRELGSWATPRTPRPPNPPPPARNFELVERVEGEKFTLVRYVAHEPATVAVAQLEPSALDSTEATVLVQPSSGPR
jgi:hypothetical protein